MSLCTEISHWDFPPTCSVQVHASCSPLEGLKDRLTWRDGASLGTDTFAAALREAGISDSTLATWQHEYFDSLVVDPINAQTVKLRDMDVEECIATLGPSTVSMSIIIIIFITIPRSPSAIKGVSSV